MVKGLKAINNLPSKAKFWQNIVQVGPEDTVKSFVYVVAQKQDSAGKKVCILDNIRGQAYVFSSLSRQYKTSLIQRD